MPRKLLRVKMTTLRIILAAALGAVITAIVFLSLPAKQEQKPVEPVEIVEIVEPAPQISQITLNVDGVECWFANYPELTYRVADQAVDVMITCRPDIIDHYLPAIERTQ